jgi:hypothetical protein
MEVTMSKKQLILAGVGAVLFLIVGAWLGTHVLKTPILIPSAVAQGIVVNQDRTNSGVAEVFTSSQDGNSLFWWRVQDNGLGQVTIFYASTGRVFVQKFSAK